MRTPSAQLGDHGDDPLWAPRFPTSSAKKNRPLGLVRHLTAVGDVEVDPSVALVQHRAVQGVGVDAVDVRERRDALLDARRRIVSCS